MRFFSLILIGVMMVASGCQPTVDVDSFIRVSGATFIRDGKPYTFMGTNFWYGLNLGSTGEAGNRDRLIRELDHLASIGVNNLRIMAGTEGPDTEGYRMLPSLQYAPGKYNEDVLKGLDFLLVEMGKRNMVAVMCLNNYWNWSGGVGQYLVWAGAADSIPNPSAPGGDWKLYQEFASSFYSHEKATKLFEEHIRFIINRRNHITGKLYKDDPVIMSWELANEPRGSNNIHGMHQWIRKTSDFIRKLDANHLITTGSEGNTSGPLAGTDVFNDHNFPSVDYATIHLWVQNWDFYNPYKADSTYEPSVKFAKDYIKGQLEKVVGLGKPVVLEEYGISRDTNSHAPGTPVTIRDKFYEEIFRIVDAEVKSGKSALSGVNFWAWAGEGRPSAPKAMWKKGDQFIGDPPHEAQGWYSVFNTDSTTIKVIKRFAQSINSH